MIAKRYFYEPEIEQHQSIEMSDRDYVAKFIYKPINEDNLTNIPKEKFELAKKICSECQVNILVEPKEDNARIESKTTEKKPKKNHSKSNKSAMARLQK